MKLLFRLLYPTTMQMNNMTMCSMRYSFGCAVSLLVFTAQSHKPRVCVSTLFCTRTNYDSKVFNTFLFRVCLKIKNFFCNIIFRINSVYLSAGMLIIPFYSAIILEIVDLLIVALVQVFYTLCMT